MKIKKIKIQRGDSTNSIKQTVRVCEEALLTNPDSLPERVELVKGLILLGEMNKAKEMCKLGLHYHPKAALLYSLLGWVYLEQSNYKIAEKNLREAIALDPKLSHANASLGFMFLETGQPQVALTYLQQALILNPSDTPVLCSLASAYTEIGQPQAALTYLQQALTLSPSDTSILCRLAFAYTYVDEYTSAYKVMLQLIRISGISFELDFIRKITFVLWYWFKAHPRWRKLLIGGLLLLAYFVFIKFPLLCVPLGLYMLVDAVKLLRQGKKAKGLILLITAGFLLSAPLLL